MLDDNFYAIRRNVSLNVWTCERRNVYTSKWIFNFRWTRKWQKAWERGRWRERVNCACNRAALFAIHSNGPISLIAKTHNFRLLLLLSHFPFSVQKKKKLYTLNRGTYIYGACKCTDVHNLCFHLKIFFNGIVFDNKTYEEKNWLNCVQAFTDKNVWKIVGLFFVHGQRSVLSSNRFYSLVTTIKVHKAIDFFICNYTV